MAKKIRRKLEEEEAAAFEFPVFDEASFVSKEFELASALALGAVLALALGAIAWALSIFGLPGLATFGICILAIAGSPFLIQKIRPSSSLYTKGDWAGLIALEFFGFLALWFLLENLSPHAF